MSASDRTDLRRRDLVQGNLRARSLSSARISQFLRHVGLPGRNLAQTLLIVLSVLAIGRLGQAIGSLESLAPDRTTGEAIVFTQPASPPADDHYIAASPVWTGSRPDAFEDPDPRPQLTSRSHARTMIGPIPEMDAWIDTAQQEAVTTASLITTVAPPEIVPQSFTTLITPDSHPAPLQPSTYRVAPGDTLLDIAGRFSVSLQSIAWANELNPATAVLSIDQTLTIPPVDGVIHVVRPGDSVVAIADRYSASADKIVESNVLVNPELLQIGQTLVVPDGAMPAPRAPTPSAAPTVASAAPAAPARPSASAPSGFAASVVDIAWRFIGYRYTWGGTSPAAGFDCSGFAYYVFRQAGRPVPRDLWGQINSGPRVSYSNLQPGDLVFFVNTYQAGLSHNGIYIGNGRFIHAIDHARGVGTSSLHDAYWSSRYFGASRP